MYKTISINDTTFTYFYCGQGEKTLVFLTGGTGISELWFRYIETLESEYKILTFDYPLELEDNNELVQKIANLFDELHITNPVLIGSSYGGYLGQLFAKKHPDMIIGLCLLSTGGLTYETKKELLEIKKIYKNMTQMVETTSIEELRKMFIKRSLEHLTTSNENEIKYMNDMLTDAYRYYTKQKSLHMTNLLLDVLNLESCTSKDFISLNRKTLLILPKDDKTFSYNAQEELINLMIEPVICRNIDGGHIATISKPDLYIKEIRKFLKNLII